MLLRKYGNLLAGLLFLGFTIAYASQIPAIRITRTSLVNSAVYPKIIAVLLAVLSLAQVALSVVELRRARRAAGDDSACEAVERKDYRTVVLTLLLSVAYVAALEPVGFLVSSFAYTFLQILVMCPRDEIRPIKFLIIAAISSVVIYYLFRNGLSLMLPAGILTDLM